MEDKDIVNNSPMLLFKFDDTVCLSEIIFDGCTHLNCPMSLYQEVIDFCKHQIDEIPHYDVADGKLEWIDKRNM